MSSKNAITTSFFDLFKVGPGPSSSHTIGPMKAAYLFLQQLTHLPPEQARRGKTFQINLYGSLSATGKGHGTDRAIVGGLLGWQPHTCDPKQLSGLMKNKEDSYTIRFQEIEVPITENAIVYHKGRTTFPHPNTMILRLLDEGGESVYEGEFYSVGGGFIQQKGYASEETIHRLPAYPYSTMEELQAHLHMTTLTLSQLMIENEKALTGLSEKDILRKIDQILDFMHKAVKRGVRAKGVLPGTIRLQRKAPLLYERAKQHASTTDSFLIFLNAYCLAASEENAAGNIVVTAPTSGASGVFPGLTYLMKYHFHYSPQKMRDGMLAAAAIGFLVKHNASISGAEMGCMGEIGTASAMGAAMLAYAAGGTIEQVEAAAEIGIEHHLGMTCDPIGGYVQIPCIERNAMGAAKAYNAYLLAMTIDPGMQKISFDSVIKVMRATGRDMSKKYKETSEAGLALSVTEC
ncbi:L-serine ammonia-lyase [Runella slithyformis]|uniref:L-serine dehydratase n=1 Tax=Runella slithyformis (strain ATCC 29530 / DSM 19594 / LMG 11500 / NCIMB 11436 / LSU 4) TaxID=761193 RepID=A0A7U3ZH55_RUNSL|nr:L-serine ammonia-lyase [Runella slithyformis]AEI47032.1 L-serine dehydratase 1 [Runella slithyformis DSM 19594]